MLKQKCVVVIILVLVLAVFIGILCIKNKNKTKEKLVTVNIDLNSISIKNRESLLKDNILYIGENKKQLENGYYDIKIVNEKNRVIVYLNKLWYAQIDNNYIQDEYLVNLTRQIALGLSNVKNRSDLEYVLFKYIKDNYISSRNKSNVENVYYENLIVSLTEEDSMSKLVIEGV